MIDISTTSEMSDYLVDSSTERIQFPANTNILLDDVGLEQGKLNSLQQIGQRAGRLVHCNQHVSHS